MPTIRFPSHRPRPVAPTRIRPLATLLAASVALLAGGCATPGPHEADAPFELSEDYTDGIVSYTVQRGDRLGDIALEFTGDMSRWREIAASNGIDDPRTLRAGSVLRIPADLIPGYADKIAARAAGSAERDGTLADAAPDAPRAEAPRTRAAASAGALAVRTGSPVELSPVETNRRFELAPLDEKMPADAGGGDDRDARADTRDATLPAPRHVRVVGSYTPKGVYAQPATYSKLLMRVAPGTLFELDGEVGDWYGVVTPDGVGYLRDADGRLVEDEGERTASIGASRG